MCVIIAKPNYASMPSPKIIEQCFKANPDGAGYMYLLDGKVEVHKGFMKLEALLEDLKKTHRRVNLNKLPLVLHFRIATAGEISPANTHPFIVSEKPEALSLTRATAEVALAHNGTMGYDAQKTWDAVHKRYTYDLAPGPSDTHTWVRDVLPYMRKVDHAVEYAALVTGSRFAVLDANEPGLIRIWGDWHKYGDLVFSNTNWDETKKAPAKGDTKALPAASTASTVATPVIKYTCAECKQLYQSNHPRCLTCKKFVCNPCLGQHVRANHSPTTGVG